ncbi:myelin transcription factor 1-like protein isoform X3 [Saccostrea cucullata]
MRRRRKKKQRNPQQMQRLRAKFVAQAKKYFGTPYAKRYWNPEDEEYYSKRFLDCCGLVRQVMLDLRKEFGFRIGPWNQAYMYDTLPITIEREEDMKAGDLVFISGIYPNPKSRQQKHHMTHVEIWAGNGCKTIGARWNKGKVQVFDHYKFQPKSFHSEQYYFKSIDTWLAGTCKSFCPEHKWKRRKFNPSKKSVFSLSGEQKKSSEAGPSSEKSDQEKLGQGVVEEEMTTGEERNEETEKAQMAEAEKTEEDEEFEEQDQDYGEDDEEDGYDDEDYDEEDDDTYLYQEDDVGQEDEDDINATPMDLQSQILSTSSSMASLQNYDSNTRSSGATNQNTESIRRSNLAIETQLASKCSITDKNGKNINNSSSSASLDSVFSKATNSMLRGKGSQSCSQLSLASKQIVKESRGQQ